MIQLPVRTACEPRLGSFPSQIVMAGRSPDLIDSGPSHSGRHAYASNIEEPKAPELLCSRPGLAAARWQ